MPLPSKPIYLYIKTSPLGLNYLGKTIKNPYTYKGSGIKWLKHLTNNNISHKEVVTRVIYVTDNIKKFATYAYKVSKKFDVVNSINWANLIDEEGQGGNTWNCISEENRVKFILSDKTKTPEHKKKLSLASTGQISTQRKAVIQFSLDGLFLKEFDSITKACNFHGFDKRRSSSIKHAIDGGRYKNIKGKKVWIQCKSAFGYKWKYKNNEI